MKSSSVQSAAISRMGNYIFLSIWGIWTISTVWQNLHSDIPLGFVLAFDGLLLIPVYMMADNLAAVITVNAEGIERKSLWKHRVLIPWEEVATIQLQQGRGNERRMSIRSNRRQRITLSNMRKDFWPLARVIVECADEKTIQVTPPWASDRDSWFYPEKW